MIGGPQGSGINSVAENFAKACVRGGIHVFAIIPTLKVNIVIIA
jgi:Pyruvate/2-oxoacid:ferredoxin oxidoreductase gamma subunit